MMIDNPLSAVMRQPHSPIIGEEVLKNSSIQTRARALIYATQWASANKKTLAVASEAFRSRVFYLQFKLLDERMGILALPS
jgi:hypothetical protein